MDDRQTEGMPHAGLGSALTLGEAGERGILREVFERLQGLPQDGVLVGPGDDTALTAVPSGAVLSTTDTMVRGLDWRDDWSSPQDVGWKIVTQNLADIASMGGRGTGLLLALMADAGTPLSWAVGLTDGIAQACARAGVPVVGGDLSGAPSGTVAVAVTALGELGDGVAAPVLRSGARPGDVVAVSGPLGRSGAGLRLLLDGGGPWEGAGARAVAYHRRPVTDLTQGPLAARAGATSMMDVSDGLVRDGDRIARASGVVLELDPQALEEMAAPLRPAVDGAALGCVLAGGEEHELLATFAPGTVPDGWIVLGAVLPAGQDGPGQDAPCVVLSGERFDPAAGGWDHFGG